MRIDASSISSAERRSLLKAWGEMDVGYKEGPVDYLWLFYSAFYTAKGISRAKTFYVTRLSIWKESALRLSFFHEYLVATIRSTNHADKREYYLLFERTAGEVNKEKKAEEELEENNAGQQDEAEVEEQANDDDFDPNDPSCAPDRKLEHKTFGAGAKSSGQHSDDEDGTRSNGPSKSEGFGMFGALFSASKASESSSGDFILADDQYQLIDRPYRSPTDIEVAWIVLGKPPEDYSDILGSPSITPVQSAPSTPISHASLPHSSQRVPFADAARQRTTSDISTVSKAPTSKSVPTDYHISSSHTVQTLKVKPHLQTSDPDTLRRSASTASALSYTSLLSTQSSPPNGVRRENHTIFLQASTSLPLIESSQGPDERGRPLSIPPGHETGPPPLPQHLSPTTSERNVEGIPASATTVENGAHRDPSLSAEGLRPPEHPLLRVETNVSSRTHTSKLSMSSRVRRKTSFSTLNYDSLPPLAARNYVYFYELVVLACRLHKCKSLYRIFTRNCYWFVGMMFHVVRVFTGVDAEIGGEDESVDRMKPSSEVMMWVNSGRMGTFLRSVRVVKAPRLFTVYALIRKWHGAVTRFEDQVNVNFADSTPQQLRIMQLAMQAERRKREAEARLMVEAETKKAAEKAKVEAKIEARAEARAEAIAGVRAEEEKRFQEAVEAERKAYEKKLREEAEAEMERKIDIMIQQAIEAERKKYQEERKKNEEEREKEKEEIEAHLREREAAMQRERLRLKKLFDEMERMQKEYTVMTLEAKTKSPQTTSSEVLVEDTDSGSSGDV